MARRLWLAGLDQEAFLKTDSALALYRAARRADPAFFPAHYAYGVLMENLHELGALKREYAAPGLGAGSFAKCLTLHAAGAADHTDYYTELLALERAGGTSICSAIYLGGRFDSTGLEQARRAVFLQPEMAGSWGEYASQLKQARRWDEAESALRQGERRVAHPAQRIDLQALRVYLRFDRGDTTGAITLARALGTAAARDGRPGIILQYLGSMTSLARALGGVDSAYAVLRQKIYIARAGGGWLDEWRNLSGLGHELVDQGQPVRAIPYHHRQIAIADSVALPGLQLVSYVQRGRAYAAMAHPAEAERDLLRAAVVGARAGDAYWLADAHHALANVYEGQARWSEASRAADQFVALTRPWLRDGLRMMSLHDAGLIRWKAGWHAAARAAYAEMVQVIDQQQVDDYWAGEYYERLGDLPRAVRYYRQGLRYEGQAAENLRGLARVHEKLGAMDSAEAAARAHDQRMKWWTPVEIPLLPAFLARRGQVDEAVRLARAWAVRQTTGGNVQSTVLAMLQVAELLLDVGKPAQVLVEAERAESLARSLNLTEELIRATRLEGVALTHLGRRDDGLAELRSTAALAAAHPTVDAVLETNLALGDALRGAGRLDQALGAYDRAAKTVELITGKLEQDLDRVGYRDRHLAPFDGAVRALIGWEASPRRLDELIGWSGRRKAAALTLATRLTSGVHTAEASRLTVAHLQQGLGPGEVLVDYIVLDSAVAVVVVTPSHSGLVRLSVPADSLQRLIERLRQPLVTTYGGRIDLARAPYDLGTAGLLHSALVAPLGPHLRGMSRLLVVPDGPLSYLAFDALVVSAAGTANAGPDYPRTRFLIDEYQVRYLPSAAWLEPAESRRTPLGPGASVLAIGAGAPGGDRELQALRAAWAGRPFRSLVGPAATEGAVRVTAEPFSILHFAGHAQADARDPLASHLRLTPDSLDDGYWHLNEIAERRSRARLVVLSACETQSGRLYGGEGLMGLARAFLVSGARAVVATQWPAGEETADLMGVFYRRLAAGDAPTAALRAAQLSLRRNPATAHPFHWAGFLLIGAG